MSKSPDAQAFREAAAHEAGVAVYYERLGIDKEVRLFRKRERLLLAAAEQREQLDKLKDERETLELKLAACTAAALGNTDRTVAERIEPGHPYYSATYGDVCRAVDREMAYRAELDRLREDYAAVSHRHNALVMAKGVTFGQSWQLGNEVLIATLRAERDAALAAETEAWKKQDALRAERDEARAERDELAGRIANALL